MKRIEVNLGTGELTEYDDFVPPVFVPPTADELREAMPTITQRQLRLTLGQAVCADVDLAVADDWDAKTEWNTASEFRRLHPRIIAIGAAFDLAPEHIDDLWLYAMTID